MLSSAIGRVDTGFFCEEDCYPGDMDKERMDYWQRRELPSHRKCSSRWLSVRVGLSWIPSFTEMLEVLGGEKGPVEQML